MSVTTVREPSHRCRLRDPQEGQIVRCDECGAYWIGRTPPNPHFHCWKRLTWLGRKLRRVE